MTIEELRAKRARYMAKGTASGADFYIEKGEGALLTDIDGNELIDFAGGIAVMNVGHSHPKVVKAIQDQAARFTHTCFMVLPYAPAVELAEKLCEAVPGDTPKSCMFINSGAEAVENAVKIARYATGRKAIIAFDGAFHGRTLLTMTLTSKVRPYKLGFGPFAPEVYKTPYPYPYRNPFGIAPDDDEALTEAYINNLEEMFISRVAAEDVAAIIIEPVAGEGGFIVPPKGYLAALRELCDKYGILLIADEVQAGMGRTGKMFATEYSGIEADLTTVAKSLAAGMPLSAVVGKKEIMDSVHQGGIGGTYGGNPVSCAAANAVFDIFESEKLLERGCQLGDKLMERFSSFQEKFSLIGEVRGLGPMVALELVEDRTSKKPAAAKAKELVAFAQKNGLILLSCGTNGNIIRVLMPLVITDAQLEKGLDIMEKGFEAIS